MLAPIPLPPAPVLASSSVSIAGRAGHAFTPHAMLQGFSCHAKGVELAAVSSTRVTARVRSKRLYEVTLRVAADRLVVACSCPARSLGLDVCKHAWAALLEIDRQGALPHLRDSRSALRISAETIDPKSVAEPAAAPGTAASGTPATVSAALSAEPQAASRKATAKTRPAAADAQPGSDVGRRTERRRGPLHARADATRTATGGQRSDPPSPPKPAGSGARRKVSVIVPPIDRPAALAGPAVPSKRPTVAARPKAAPTKPARSTSPKKERP